MFALPEFSNTEAVELAVLAAIKAKLFASYGVGRTVYDPLKVMPPTVVGTSTTKAPLGAYPWFGKRTLMTGELFVVEKYGTCPGKLAVKVPDPAVVVLINAPVGVNEMLKVVEDKIRCPCRNTGWQRTTARNGKFDNGP